MRGVGSGRWIDELGSGLLELRCCVAGLWAVGSVTGEGRANWEYLLIKVFEI